jgi:hypothetical protein
VTINFPCIDCGEPLKVVLQDGRLLNPEEASGLMAYVSVPFWKWFEDVGYA